MEDFSQEEEQIISFLERYEELMQDFKGYVDIHQHLSNKIEKIFNEIKFIENKLKEFGIQLAEFEEEDAGK